MSGPVAPKDPTKKRPAIYLMLDSNIAGKPWENGKIQDVNYMDNRLLSQVKGICEEIDEEILNLLAHTNTFRQLVHSIGISITATKEEEKDSHVEFMLHTYGVEDKYNSGEKIRVLCPCNGEEQTILLEDTEIGLKDDIIGALYFTFPEECQSAITTIKFYLNDGYQVPEVQVDPPVDFQSNRYHEMIENSLYSLGNVKRLKKAIEKAKKAHDVTIAYIGGSITQGAGAKPIHTECYAYRSYQGFCDRFAKDPSKMHFVKAGVGGTSSELGMLRYEPEVTQNGTIVPDVVMVEFAVNDEGDETKGICFESLIRKIANGPGNPAVILVFSVFMNEWNLEDRLVPIGTYYDLPMVSIKKAVVPQFRLTPSVITKRQFFYDIFHPTNDGHRIMGDCLIHLFEKVDGSPDVPEESDFQKPPRMGNDFEEVLTLDQTNVQEYFPVEEKGFDHKDPALQNVERNLSLDPSPVFPNGWHKTEEEEDAFFSFRVEAKKLLLITKDSGEPAYGKADVYVDGNIARTIDPLENGWDHTNAQIILNEKESKDHSIKVVMHPGDEKKRFTILGIGIVR